MAMIAQAKAALRAAAGGVYWASRHVLGSLRGRAAILMYHRVLPREELDATFVQPGLYVTPATFERHLRFLASNFDVLSFCELLAMWEEGRWDERARYCVITFDDGWLDNYTHAFPLLRARALPATIFLPTDLIGTHGSLWFDRAGASLKRRARGTPEEWDALIESAKGMTEPERGVWLDEIEREAGGRPAGARRFIDWAEARHMSRHRISFGSHTRTHANLTRLAGAALDAELRDPLQALYAEGVDTVPILAYPNGDHTEAVVAAARAAGYRGAVTTRPGLESRRPADPFRLKRIGAHDDVTRSVSLFALHVARQARPRAAREECSC